MPAPLRLEVFELPDMADQPGLMMPEDMEELRLKAYERGYLAGWDDAMAQSRREDDAAHARLAQMLERVNFTYHDARGHVLNGLEPLLRAVLDTVIPAAARKALVPLVLEQVLPLAAVAGTPPLRLHVPAGMRAAFETAFDGMVLPPLEIIEDPDADALSARLSLGGQVQQVDLSGVVRRLSGALDRFYQLQTQESSHG